MNLNNIQLSDWLVSELYRDNLLEPTPGVRYATTTTVPASQPAPPAAPENVAAASPQKPLPVREDDAATTAPANTGTPIPPAVPPRTATQDTSIPAAQPRTANPQAPSGDQPYKVLGHNRRNFVILVNSPGDAFLPDDQLAFLTKILEACRMTIADVAIVNQASRPLTFTALKDQLQPASMLLFGIDPVEVQVPITFPVFKLQAWDQCTFLCAPPLALLTGNSPESRTLKSNLWGCLKNLFGI